MKRVRDEFLISQSDRQQAQTRLSQHYEHTCTVPFRYEVLTTDYEQMSIILWVTYVVNKK